MKRLSWNGNPPGDREPTGHREWSREGRGVGCAWQSVWWVYPIFTGFRLKSW
ncbi:hypothetical protein ATK36_4981 [Amycolatopsis sulphurea]|uniref:Uncharacterized protein n=1 Tax=Amycolatopsis sulphurea TaxID=76022 RepID=A0A2A9FGD0_9PSEU|nr:hypothetical protein ATK36_4981 [Amycolatopsis sulphurea]